MCLKPYKNNCSNLFSSTSSNLKKGVQIMQNSVRQFWALYIFFKSTHPRGGWGPTFIQQKNTISDSWRKLIRSKIENRTHLRVTTTFCLQRSRTVHALHSNKVVLSPHILHSCFKIKWNLKGGKSKKINLSLEKIAIKV